MTTKKEVDSTVNRQWANRPDDQRFLTLQELHQFTKSRADGSEVGVVSTEEMRVHGVVGDQLVINTEFGPKFFTNWSFGQVSALAAAPAAYLRRLPAPLAAECLNHGLQRAEQKKSLLVVNGNDTLRCRTAETYGRIWDHEVVAAVRSVAEDGVWRVPAASYAGADPRRATTLYGSDRDVFIFLVDSDHPIEVPGEPKPLYRGFYVWNSEVGSKTFGLCTFLYETVCDNRNIWGVSQKTELRIRHSAGAPERFIREGHAALREYANEAAQPLLDKIKRVQAIKVGDDEEEVAAFLRKRGLTLAKTKAAIEQVKQDGKDPRSLWSLTQGITASARSVGTTDTRIEIERFAGNLLEAAVN